MIVLNRSVGEQAANPINIAIVSDFMKENKSEVKIGQIGHKLKSLSPC